MKKSPILLIILDGFGLAPESVGNAITQKTAPNIFGYQSHYPSTKLVAHGEAVGLFSGQSGNSESGHFAIGAGRIVKQDLVHVSETIDDGTFYKNTAFQQGFVHAEKNNSSIHVFGLLTNGQSPHARPDHLYALLEFFRKQSHKNIYLHLFTDGRDAPPHSAVEFLKELREKMNKNEHIATIMGRHYAMDRNKNWDRTQKAYETIVHGTAEFTANSAEEAIAAAYNRNETDEYIAPTVIVKGDGSPVATVSDNDVIYFFNTRSDRARQLSKTFVQKDFEGMNKNSFTRDLIVKNIVFVAMTDFGPDLPDMLTAFPSPDIDNCLAKAIGEERTQLFISESEKYAHVTFFLNGGYPEPINGEVRELIRSENIYDFAKKPGMHSKEITKRIVEYLRNDTFDFICVNFPNADMVGHTGNIQATKKAVKIVDNCVKKLVKVNKRNGGVTMITADHGNAEDMLTEGGEMVTEHSKNLVPCIIISDTESMQLRARGSLIDIAPTLLDIMNITKPKEMTGTTLIKQK